MSEHVVRLHSVNIYNIRLLGDELLCGGRQTDRQADGRTDVTKPFISFSNCFANEPKSRYSKPRIHGRAAYWGNEASKPLAREYLTTALERMSKAITMGKQEQIQVPAY